MYLIIFVVTWKYASSSPTSMRIITFVVRDILHTYPRENFVEIAYCPEAETS